MPFDRNGLEKKFSPEYGKLNAAQKRAVDISGGPVRVLGGAGTGKTHILSLRIARILLNTDAQPEDIICFTHTEAASLILRRRLQQLIGASGCKVSIYTFHAFCSEVMQKNLCLFGGEPLQLASQFEEVQFLKELIDNFPKNHRLKRYRGDVYFEIGHLQQLFSDIKDKGLNPGYIHQEMDEYLNSRPGREAFGVSEDFGEFRKEDVQADKMVGEMQKVERMRSAVNEFEKYQSLLSSNNRYDPGDLTSRVVFAFEEGRILSPGLEKYRYILVDDYPYINGAQEQLLRSLVTYCQTPNIFITADSNLGISGWPRARMETMRLIPKTMDDAWFTISLTHHYRNPECLPELAKAILGHNKQEQLAEAEGSGKNHRAAVAGIGEMSYAPILTEYNTLHDEMADITNMVHEFIGKGIPPAQIAVIYREKKYVEQLAAYFRLRNLPLCFTHKINILDHSLIKKVIKLLCYLNAEHAVPFSGDDMLFEMLHYDFYGIEMREIANLATNVNKRKSDGEQTSIRMLLSDKANTPPKDLFDKGLSPKLKQFACIVEKLIRDVPNLTLIQLFENVIKETGLLFFIKSRNVTDEMRTITALHDFIKEETTRNSSLSLGGLVSILELMYKEGLPLSITPAMQGDGVNLLTANGSQGLEFKHVFLAGVNAHTWEKRKNGAYHFPCTMFGCSSIMHEEQGTEALRKQFYVATTRSKEHLQISYTRLGMDGQQASPSMFITEILEQHPLPITKTELQAGEILDFNLLPFAARAPEIGKAEEPFVRSVLDKFVMSVSALNTYLTCPLGFYYKNILRIPAAKNEATEFGSAVHHALEQLFRKMQDGKQQQFPGVEEMIADFKWYMHRQRAGFTNQAFARRIEYGDEVLRSYYARYIRTWNKVVAVERNIRAVINGVQIRGKLDKLEFDGRNVNVVDYKSGDIEKAWPKMQPPHGQCPDGGDYWRQAVFYKILVDNYPQKAWKATSTEFDFIEPDKTKAYRKEKILISPPDVQTVIHQLTDTWTKIQAGDFYRGCGKPTCHWCSFVKENGLAISLPELAGGSLGD